MHLRLFSKEKGKERGSRNHAPLVFLNRSIFYRERLCAPFPFSLLFFERVYNIRICFKVFSLSFPGSRFCISSFGTSANFRLAKPSFPQKAYLNKKAHRWAIFISFCKIKSYDREFSSLAIFVIMI